MQHREHCPRCKSKSLKVVDVNCEAALNWTASSCQGCGLFGRKLSHSVPLKRIGAQPPTTLDDTNAFVLSSAERKNCKWSPNRPNLKKPCQ